jgi:DNA-nicking Smr family endonuclease
MTADESRKGRRLSSDDIALWDGVTRTVRPLRKRARPKEAHPEPAEPATPAKAKASRRAAAATAVPVTPPAPKKPPPLAPLDRKAKQKIARGRETIDARLDLHGHSQAEAHDALLRFLRRTQARGGRVVLVITGKGGRNLGGRGESGGVLKRAVPLWLALPEFRDTVIGFVSAAAGHGGEGALYVRLRKASHPVGD